MSYSIIFETKVIALPDGRIIHLERSGCNNDEEGRVATEFYGKLYTKGEFDEYIKSFENTKHDGEGFEMKIGSRYCNLSDYGKHLRTMWNRAVPFEEFKNQRLNFYTIKIKGVELSNDDKSFYPINEWKEISHEFIRKGIRYKLVKEHLTELSDIISYLEDDKTN